MRVAEIKCSGAVVLRCERCGERLVLLGLERDWSSEGWTAFGCSGCGEKFTLADRLGVDEGQTSGGT